MSNQAIVRHLGFTLVELLFSIVIAALLVGIGLPSYQGAVTRAKNNRAIKDISELQVSIQRYYTISATLPNSLADIRAVPLDPWDNPYQYLNIQNSRNRGQVRKDHSLVPLNNDYDLYSSGEDGRSSPPLTARMSHDDIVRANNGGFIGLASDY